MANLKMKEDSPSPRYTSLRDVLGMMYERFNSTSPTMHDVQFSPSAFTPDSKQKYLQKMRLERRETNESMGGEYEPLKNETEQWTKRKGMPRKNPSKTELSSVQYPSDSNASANTSANVKVIENEIVNSFSMCVIYGLINAAIVLPVIMSFGSIIYSDEIFRPYLPTLIKLTVISGMVHQVAFTTLSSLPFAVGQVQDAGLIFLSSMASNIVSYCKREGHDDVEVILATVTIGLAIYTMLLGVALVLIAKLNLAGYVQQLPTPVVGGYLAFIGFFCGQNGMALMAGVEIKGVTEWYKLVQDFQTFMWVLPGLMGGLLIYLLVRTIRHMAVLPTCIISIVITFYAVLGFTGMTVQDARDDGWVTNADAPPVWYKTWDYLRFDKVVWSALPHETVTLISMIFVVALSSSLDVAAIELELGDPLDYNHELQTVGLSNIISGLTGGYTGSYIFSQSIFSLRAGIRSRTSGYIIALAEFISVVLPISILSYVPNFFFGSLLIMIAVDLMYEWLWDVRKKTTNAEYGVALTTFVLIQVMSVEYGILAGLAIYFILWKVFKLDMGQDENTKDNMDGDTIPMSSTNGSLANFDYGAMCEGTSDGGYGTSSRYEFDTQDDTITDETLLV